ncbi:MAG: 5-formyltetrahydrofolate cyclo-ligase [Kiritimatiellia bacterium]
MDKQTIRNEMRARRKALAPDEKARASAVIGDKLFSLVAAHPCLVPPGGAAALAVYLASPDEIDLTRLIRRALEVGMTVAAPRWNGTAYGLARLKSLCPGDLREGPMGILEPAAADPVRPQQVGVWIVPGLAFTRDGRRLGYGGGWYDRLMAGAREDAVKIGVAHAFQMVDDLPDEPHDVRLTAVVDERGAARLPGPDLV